MYPAGLYSPHIRPPTLARRHRCFPFPCTSFQQGTPQDSGIIPSSSRGVSSANRLPSPARRDIPRLYVAETLIRNVGPDPDLIAHRGADWQVSYRFLLAEVGIPSTHGNVKDGRSGCKYWVEPSSDENDPVDFATVRPQLSAALRLDVQVQVPRSRSPLNLYPAPIPSLGFVASPRPSPD